MLCSRRSCFQLRVVVPVRCTLLSHVSMLTGELPTHQRRVPQSLVFTYDSIRHPSLPPQRLEGELDGRTEWSRVVVMFFRGETGFRGSYRRPTT